MEIELKYLIDGGEKAEMIFADKTVISMIDKDEETMNMDAVYFDTADMSLTEQGIAFRIRKEGSSYIGTLKWNGSSENGMHKRQEINVPVSDDAAGTPDLNIFSQSEMSDVLEAIVGTREMRPIMEMDFVRRKARLDTGRSICEMSVDMGEVRAGGKKIPISELEIELFSGNEEDIIKIGEELSEKYGLKPENKSKFQRGYELIVQK